MSSSSTDNADSKATRAADDKEDNDSIEDTAAKQLTVQIEDLSIKNKQGDTPISTNNADNTNNTKTTCAACGNEGEKDSMNTCNKCKMVHYCNAACKKKHKSKHKKKCDRRVAELHDDALFKEPPAREECPICFLPQPFDPRKAAFFPCCGKIICSGCIYSMVMEDIKKGKELEEPLCAFCRTPETSSDEEKNRMLKKLVEKGNAAAYNKLASCYAQGTNGIPRDHQKAAELWLKAGELGCAEAYSQLGFLYYNGIGVEGDKKKAKHYWELAAMKGDVIARYQLGCEEGQAGNEHRAMKHFILAARAGLPECLDKVKTGFMYSLVSKDEFEQNLRASHERQNEMKSDARDAAADLAHSVEH